MSDIKDLVDQTIDPFETTPAAETIDGDVRRGQAALAQRRRSRVIRSSFGGTALVASAIGVAVVVGAPDGTDDTGRPEPSPRIGADPDSETGGGAVQLVAYHGEQLEGFIVDRVPDGWSLQGSNAFRLTVAPRGDTSSSDSFVGKLVVMLLSASARQELPRGEPVEVDGRDGVVTHTREADTLTYEDGAGHLVQVQAWRSALAWGNEQLVRFAEGVTVTAAAEAGVG